MPTIPAIAAVTLLRTAHHDQSDPDLDLAFENVIVANDTAPTVAVIEFGMCRNESLDLGLNDLL